MTVKFSGGSGSSSDYETGKEPIPLRGKIFLGVVGILVLVVLGYLFC